MLKFKGRYIYMTAYASDHCGYNWNMDASMRICPEQDAAQLAVSVCARLIGMILRLRAASA